jgi:aspartyl-tRNA(Asn)/glutamyl-tRNA(Gln) amidotransferase subunit A
MQITLYALDRIKRFDGQYHAFITVTRERACSDASRADREIAAGIDKGPLHGIPYALKDSIDTQGIRTTAGSSTFLDHIPGRDAAAATLMREAGGVLLGKLAMYEFGAVGPSFDLPFSAVRNPWDRNRITGGSSSGCAAAVAAGFARVVIGSDSGGSIRSPASYCGVVGLKPTYGLLDDTGIFPLSPSVDHAGIMAASVEDAAICLDVLQGRKPKAATADVSRGVCGLRIAYGRNWSAGQADIDVQKALDEAAARLSALGAQITEVQLPDYELIEACGAVLIQAEAFRLHATRLKSMPELYGCLAFQNLASGAILTQGDEAAARDLKRRTAETFDRAIFQHFDALLLASTLTSAPAFSEFDGKTPRWTAMRTIPFNLTGHPALAVPSTLSSHGLPLGLQIVGRHGGEAMVCRIGAACAAHLRCPELAGELAKNPG